MKNKALLSTVILALMMVLPLQSYATSMDTTGKKITTQDEIWTLEEAYFTNLYQANYEGVLALVHSAFLGWPDSVPQPLGKEESARFMKQLIARPSSCSLRIERAGIRILKDIVLTQYTLRVQCVNTPGAPKTLSSRITHTWVKEGDRWALLGGMSYDLPADGEL